VRRTSLLAAVALIGSTLIVLNVNSAHADTQEPGTPLPAGPGGTPYRIRVSDDVVLATWGTSRATATLYRTPADGSGTWQPVLDPETSTPIVDPAILGNGLVVTQPFTPPGDACATQRVLTTTTAWTVPQPPSGCVGSVVTGTGHDLVAVPVPGQSQGPDRNDYQVYDAAKGPAGGVLEQVQGQRPALDGTWVVTVTPYAVWATDTSGQHSYVRAPIPAGCDFGQVAKAVGDPTTSSGYALVHCLDGEGRLTSQLVVPLDGRVPLPLSTNSWSLGNGFVYMLESTSPGAEVRVMDFSAARTQHVYGPLNTAPGSDSGTPRVAWPTASGLVNTAVLDWLGTTPTKADDSTPPQVTLASPPAAVRMSDPVSGTPLQFSWSGVDNASGPVLYDVEAHRSEMPSGWSALFYSRRTLGTVATIYANPSEIVCVRVRGEDRAGNYSAWSKRCSRVDTARPTMKFQSDPLRPVVRRLGQVAVRFPLQGRDDGPVASYEVQRRSRNAGRTAGTWHTPRRWQVVTSSHVDARAGEHREVCFRARATDQVGRVSTWGKAWCRTTPYDDPALTAHGARRIHADDSLGGTATALGAHGSLTLPDVSGREIWVRASGREVACPLVNWGARRFFGGPHACEFGPSHHGYRWYSWRVHTLRRGTIRVSSPLYDPLTVDAVAVVR
jgi:hypothetical protein